MQIRYTNHTEEEIQRMAVKIRLLDAKSIIFGTAIFAAIAGGASAWRLATMHVELKPLKEFQFTPEDPNTEEFDLKEPLREILEEQIRDKPREMEDLETPNIQMTTDPSESTLRQEVIKTETIEVTREIKVDTTPMDIIEAPEELVDVSQDTAYAMTPIASVVPAPADLFKYQVPDPRHRPDAVLLSRAPHPGKSFTISPQQFGDVNAPTIGEIGPVSINLFGDGDYMGALGRSGALETRTAVDLALRWLALHQEPDGYWDVHKWDPEDAEGAPVVDSDGSRGQHNRGIAGFAVLAFMGGGHTIRKGEYRTHLLRALEWILAQEDPKTGKISNNMYEQAICTIALCEASGRSPDDRLGATARRATDFCVKARAADDGWRYTPNHSDGADMSVTSWFLQALKTAKLANIKFEHEIFSRGLAYVDQLTDRGGVRGTSGAVGYRYVADLKYTQAHPALTCAAMVIRQFSGMGVRSEVLVQGAELTKLTPPDWDANKDFYYWYYATYAMHNMGGEHRIWWNRRIRDVLLDNQSKKGHQAGSWDPENVKWDAGRVYCTALGALCLEVYYRYGEALQSFGTVPDLDELFFR